MLPITRRATAAGTTAWVVLDRNKRDFGAALAFIPSSGAVLTGKVQHTFDNFYDKVPVTLSRVTTTATMLLANHGLTVDDYVVVEAVAPFAGEFPVASVIDADNITYTVLDSGATSAQGIAGKARVFDHEDMVAMSTRTDGNYMFPPAACRLNLTAYTSGLADFVVIQQG